MLRRLIPALALAATALAAPGPAGAKSFEIVRTGVFALSTDLLVRAMAKELCSCWHVSRVGEGGPMLEGVAMCLERAQLPITPGLIRALTNIEVSPDAAEFEVDPTLLGALAGLFQGAEAVAVYDPAAPQFGCRLAPDSR